MVLFITSQGQSVQPSTLVLTTFRMLDGCSTTQAELAAILMALVYARDTKRDGIVIHTDSIPDLQAIACPYYLDNTHMLTRLHLLLWELHTTGDPVTFSWLLSHAGVPGNQVADPAVKAATLLAAVACMVPPSTAQLMSAMVIRASRSFID